ncbi:hypothetical protein N7462_000621 [Penicillium macrosclerotiorum]|uniref:uncharacterized protein n=1 Tax=Penicillium macrosclerotiorum TaxID=303699 RepID=UPI002548BFAD|nr:uncharacterized protein N7462_000621 [Penicillium macrosclerotiorum]KAJ5698616.1 hypothetical protein N7462_000621 [Penicillium macrosclerotiorum]
MGLIFINSYETLDVAAYRDSYPSSLTIAVPSRLYFQQTEDKPFAGMRIGVEDAVNLCNTKASTSSHRFDDLYGSRKSDEPVIQRLVDLGFVIVGKVRTTEMADSKNPDCGDERDCGSAAAVASYPWLDFALLTDTLGSLRAPASTQGLFSMRPSLNAAGSTRLIPYTPLVNTIGGFARDAASFAKLSRALYGSRGEGQKPRMILYPVEFWPKGIDKNHDLLETFIVKLEKYLGIERTPVSLEELWNATKPIKSEIALQDYMADLMKWNEGNDQRGRGSIDVDNKMMRGNEAQLRYRSDWVSTSMKETEEAGIRKWKSFKSWYDTNVLPPAKDGVSDTLLLLPWIIEKPGFQDKYQDRLQGFPGTGLFFSNPSLYAQAPEAIVPVGQIPFTSRITGQKEFLSTCIGISSGRGSDVMLSDFVENFMSGDNERRLELKFQEL